MAKKNSTGGKELTFDDIKNDLKKLSTIGGTLETNDFATVNDYVHTGNYMLNAVISGSLNKGIPIKRVLELSGEKGSAKTYVMLNILSQAQKQGMMCLWYDTETALDKHGIAPEFGIDMDNVWYEPINVIELLTKHLMQFLNPLIQKKRDGYKIPKLLIVIDSLGNLVSNKAYEDSLKEDIKADMTRAKSIGALFNLIAIPIGELEACLVYSNHVYTDNSSFIATNKGKGGKGREYIASTLVEFYKSGGKDDGVTKNGVIIRAKTNQKNRFAIPGEIQFHVDFRKGMNPYIGLPFKGLPFKQDWFIDLEVEGWDICGLQYGKILNQKEFEEVANKKGDKFSKEIIEIQNTQYKQNESIFYFANRENVKKLDLGGIRNLGIAIKHLCKDVPLKDFYSSTVFTEDVLSAIDEKIIKPKFSYGSTSTSFEEELAEFDSETNAIEDLATEIGF